LEFFGKDKRWNNTFASRCRSCARIAARKWADEHPEHVLEKALKWQRDNPERVRKRNNIWRYNNQERVRYLRIISQAKRHALNPEARRIYKQRYQARKRNLPENITMKEWRFALDYFGGRCAVCGRPPGLFHTLAMDHWIPLNSPDCPGTIPTNLLPLCHGVNGCNNSKRDLEPLSWLNEQFGKRKACQIWKRILIYFSSLS
jgi:hypothetical protein